MAFIKGNVVCGKEVFLAHDADVIGNVTLGDDSSVWYNAVVRGDADTITIGDRTNIQDNATLHVDKGYPISVGNDVTVGHNVVLHGCTVGDNTIIGMGSTVMNGAKIGKNCIIGACALITQGKVIPDNSLVMGAPGKIIRELTEEEIEDNLKTAEGYVEEKNFHMTL